MVKDMICFDDVSYCYSRTKRWVLRKINLSIKQGEFIAVMGANGSGKSTLCQCINGIIPHSLSGTLRGKVTVAGLDTQETTVAELSRHVGVVLEDPETQIFTHSIEEETAFGPENLQLPAAEIKERIEWALNVVGLWHRVKDSPLALSGGQKQRLIIATALVMQPEILVLDEPTSQLDPIGTREVFEVIYKIRGMHSMTIVMATHKSEEIAEYADKICVINNGRIVAFDSPHVIFEQFDLLKDNWIRPPQVSELSRRMSEKGLPMSRHPIILDEAEQAIYQLFKNKETFS
ncbi:MAG: ABC transporter ATP-binding protein [Fastidiosipila sp.]|nr:ABC transporter ATP-binding protein [Fastidiosipila sp.]